MNAQVQCRVDHNALKKPEEAAEDSEMQVEKDAGMQAAKESGRIAPPR